MLHKVSFSTQLYNETFSEYLERNETTHGDEILVDMTEPMGKLVSYLNIFHGHSVYDCKAYVTTTDERVLIAVFDIMGKFHDCYIIKHDSIKNIEIEKVFGGMQIAFEGEAQYGKVSIKMYAANKQFGTDLKKQAEHLHLFAENMKKIKENPKCFIHNTCRIPHAKGDVNAVKLSFVELTDKQRIRLINNRTLKDFSVETNNIDIIAGVYEANRDIVLVRYSWASPILTRDGMISGYMLLYGNKEYYIEEKSNWNDVNVNGLVNNSPFSNEVIEKMIHYYEEADNEYCDLKKNVVKRYEKEYTTNIHSFLKFYIEEIMMKHILFVDKATDNEIMAIGNFMSGMFDKIEKKDKAFIFYLNNEITLVRDKHSDFFLTCVCAGLPHGHEGWHNEVYLINMNGSMELKWYYMDAFGPNNYPADEDLGLLSRQEAAFQLYFGNVRAWRNEEKRKITSCSYIE